MSNLKYYFIAKEFSTTMQASENSMTANIKRDREVNPVTTPASKSLVSSQASSNVITGKRENEIKENETKHPQ